MCRVVVRDSKKDKEFIIYNHIFSKDYYSFTIPQLVQDLKQYNLELTADYVQTEINIFIRSGLIKQNFKKYTVCGR